MSRRADEEVDASSPPPESTPPDHLELRKDLLDAFITFWEPSATMFGARVDVKLHPMISYSYPQKGNPDFRCNLDFEEWLSQVKKQLEVAASEIENLQARLASERKAWLDQNVHLAELLQASNVALASVEEERDALKLRAMDAEGQVKWQRTRAVAAEANQERSRRIEEAAAKVATPEHFEMADMPKSLWNAIVELSNVLHGKNPDGSALSTDTPDPVGDVITEAYRDSDGPPPGFEASLEMMQPAIDSVPDTPATLQEGSRE